MMRVTLRRWYSGSANCNRNSAASNATAGAADSAAVLMAVAAVSVFGFIVMTARTNRPA